MARWQQWLKGLVPNMHGTEGDNPDEKPKGMKPFVMLLLVAGLAFIMFSRWDSPPPSTPSPIINNDTNGSSYFSATSDERVLERRLEQWLSQMEHVGDVRVLITFERGDLVEYVMERTMESSETVEAEAGGTPQRIRSEQRQTERPLLQRTDQGRTETLVPVTVHSPHIRGVVVLASGAGNADVRYQISRAVQTALNVPAHRVDVLPKR